MVTIEDAETGRRIQVSEAEAYAALSEAGIPDEVLAQFGLYPGPRVATLLERVNEVLTDVARAAKSEQVTTGHISPDTAEVLARIGSFSQTALRAVLVGQFDPRTNPGACGIDGCGCG